MKRLSPNWQAVCLVSTSLSNENDSGTSLCLLSNLIMANYIDCLLLYDEDNRIIYIFFKYFVTHRAIMNRIIK